MCALVSAYVIPFPYPAIPSLDLRAINLQMSNVLTCLFNVSVALPSVLSPALIDVFDSYSVDKIPASRVGSCKLEQEEEYLS